METIKFAMFVGMEAFVIGTVGITLLAGIYQLVRDKARRGQARTAAATHEA